MLKRLRKEEAGRYYGTPLVDDKDDKVNRRYET